MTLQQIVDEYVQGLIKGKAEAQKPGFAQQKKARRNFYHDIKHVLNMEKIMHGRDLLFECVFNRDRHLWLMSYKMAHAATDGLYIGGVLNASYANFEELYDRVRALILPIDGIGDVAVYDIAMRIGFLRRIAVYPTDKVYYHVYLRESARKLLGVSRLRSFRDDTSLFRCILPNMPSIFIEDLLCCMHEMICPESKKYDGISPSPLSKYGPFTMGSTPVSFPLTISNYFLK